MSDNSISIRGSADTGGGNIVGRDSLNIFNLAINLAQDKLPKGDPFPQRLEQSFSSLQILLSTLRAWKEVHNGLDNLRSKFDQFRYPIERAHAKRQVIDYKSIKLYWRPVIESVRGFEKHQKKASEAEEVFLNNDLIPYQEDRDDDVLMEKQKGHGLIDLAQHLDVHIIETYSQSLQFLSPEHEFALQNIKRKLGLRNHWWHQITDLTDELDSYITESMYLSDKLLRASAEYLSEFYKAQFTPTRGIKK